MRKYKGVFYWKEGGMWYCELIQEPFETLKALKYYISDWKSFNP